MCPEGAAALVRPMLDQLYPEGLQLMERIHFGAEGECKEKGAAERSCYRLTTAPIPHPAGLLWMGRYRNQDLRE